MGAFLSRPWLLGELLRNFSSAWLTALLPLVRACAEDVARGALSVGLLQATRERFQAMLRGHTSLFVRGLARNFGKCDANHAVLQCLGAPCAHAVLNHESPCTFCVP